jgi:hypothetical protein
MRLMDGARTRAFDVVVVEARDRLSRDMEDLAGIHKRLSFLGIEIDAVHDGTADSILVGIRGLVGQTLCEDGAKKVRRGMAGVVRVAALAASLAGHAEAEDERGPLVKTFRALVHSVTIPPSGPREGFQVEVEGKLAALIGGDAFPQAKCSGERW